MPGIAAASLGSSPPSALRSELRLGVVCASCAASKLTDTRAVSSTRMGSPRPRPVLAGAVLGCAALYRPAGPRRKGCLGALYHGTHQARNLPDPQAVAAPVEELRIERIRPDV